MLLSPTTKNISLLGTSCSTLCTQPPPLWASFRTPQHTPHLVNCASPFRLLFICHLLREPSLVSLTRSDLPVTSFLSTTDLSFAACIRIPNFPFISVIICLASASLLLCNGGPVHWLGVGVGVICSSARLQWCKCNHSRLQATNNCGS